MGQEKMKSKILPIVWYLIALLVFVGILIAGTKVCRFQPLMVVGMAWVLSIVAAWAAGALTLRVKPDLRYSTKSQIDGLGYVHQPMNVVVNMTFLAIVCALTCVVKMIKN